MLSHDLAAHAELMRTIAGAGTDPARTVTVRASYFAALAAEFEQWAAEARTLEAQPVPPAARLNAMTLRQALGGKVLSLELWRQRLKGRQP